MDPTAAGAAAGGGMVTLLQMVFAVIVIVSMWKIFVKAGEAGWAAIVPIYNGYIMLKIAGKPWWWLLLMFIPVVNIVVGIIASIALCARFGKGVGFAIGTILLSFIFLPMLAFGSAQYQQQATAAPAQA